MKFFNRFRTNSKTATAPPTGTAATGGESPASSNQTEPADDASSSASIESNDATDEPDDVDTASSSSTEADRIREQLREHPPSDDVCPICFGNFEIPCRAPCGHWYCGGCILQYWNYSAALKPCKCPMCSQFIYALMPEKSLYDSHEAEISKVLRSVGDYNTLFKGGVSGLVRKFLATPVYMKRMFYDLLNPDRPGAHLHQLRMIAMLLGVLYSFSPIDFLLIGRRNVVDVFDYSAFALSFVLYLVGLFLRRRRQREVRALPEFQMDPHAAADD